MNKKRYRQISITESFFNCKKTNNTSETSTMEQNLRDLLAAAAEKRITASTKFVNPKDIQEASTSHLIETEENLETPNSDEIFVPSSQELFPDSEELLLTKSPTEIPETPEYNSDTVDAEKCSAEIFSDNLEFQALLEDESNSEEQTAEICLNRIPACSIPLPKLEPLENHFILFSPHILEDRAPRPFPSTYRDVWDFHHVRMPCSPSNKYPIENQNGEKHIKSRWDLICRSLRRNIETSYQLEEAIMQYNAQYKGKWNFNSLHAFFERILPEDESLHFFETILPVMVNFALDLPNICTQPPPLLKKNKDYKITMSQKQIGCLLLNAFFCTFPRRNNYSRYRKDKFPTEYSSYPDINFNRLFYGVKNRIQPSNAEKLKCLINYFRRITQKEPTGTVTFHRQYLKNLPSWKDSSKGLKTAIVRHSGLIETDGNGMLQVDFANKFIGGGVLGHGCVQEEIRFVICPELIVSRLFSECLGPTEAIIITGIEQYNSYSGYSNTFKWEGNFFDKTPRDSWGRRCTQLVAMDATHFGNTVEQYKPLYIERELNKAFCGFYEAANPANLAAVATGNWGCGAFRGNPVLKFILQCMAASQANRDMLYFTFGNKTLKTQLEIIHGILVEKNISVGDVWRILMKYFTSAKVRNGQPSPALYDFICNIFDDDEETEELIAPTQRDETELTDSDRVALENLIKHADSDCDTQENTNDPG